MKMELEMTERDKKLLVFLAIFVVVVCFGYWGIRPIWSDITEIEEQILDDEDIQAMNEIKIADLPLIQTDIETLENDINEARGCYFSMMTSDEVDKYFTDMVLSYNLSSYDLEITMPESSCDLQPYQYSEKFLKGEEVTEIDVEQLSQLEQVEEAAEDGEEDTEEEEADEEDEVEVDNGIYVAEISMRLGGTLSDLTKLINDLSNTDRKLRVSQYSYTTTQSIQTGEDETYEVAENRVLNMTVEIYMCEE